MRFLKTIIAAALVALLPLAGALAQGTVPQQFINAQTGTSYTFVGQDCSKMVTFTNAAAIAATLPQAGTASFIAGCFLDVKNLSTGTLTITPTTSTIDGAATKVLSTNEGVRIVNNGTNYFTQPAKPGIAALGSGATGSSAGSSLFTFGTGGPTVTNVTPSAWIRFTLTDGNVYFMPAWR